MRLQSRHQVPVDLNKRLLGHRVLIQDQLSGDGTRHLRQFVLYHDDLQTKVVCFEILYYDLLTVKKPLLPCYLGGFFMDLYFT